MDNQKLKALAEYLEISIEDIEEGYNENYFDYEGKEYLVLTDEEADEKAGEYIKDLLWAFNSSFIIENSSILDFDEGSEKIIKAIQEQYENGNEAMKKLIDDMDDFISNAISADGRGRFINSYDGEEIEQEDYFIYRMN
jgi:hypothetical protein